MRGSDIRSKAVTDGPLGLVTPLNFHFRIISVIKLAFYDRLTGGIMTHA